MPPTVYLIDGHALAYRTYYALTASAGSRFSTSGGEPTAGIYGFTSVLLRLLDQERPEFLAVTFDTGKTFRDEIYPEYKATREKMPEDLRPQIQRIRQLVDAFNIPRLEVEGYEADDVLGSLARWAVDQGLGVKIITGDRDLLQLVNERVVVSLPGRSLSDAQDYLVADVIKTLGVRPDQVVDYKALVGDKSDNIPGVRGIGEKTAAKLLETYGNLDAIYAHLDEIGGSAANKLKAEREQAYLSRKLAAIVTNLDVGIDLDQARPEKFNPAEVESLFRELEFRTLMPRLQSLKEAYGLERARKNIEQLSFFVTPETEMKSSTVDIGGIRAHIIDTPEALENLVRVLNQARVISFDTETTSTDQMRADLVGISLAVDGENGYYIPVGHSKGFGSQLPVKQVLAALGGPLRDKGIAKAGHNLKYDFVMLARYGLRVQPLKFDTMIAEWLINPDSRNLGLKNLAWVRLDFRMTNIEELIGSGKKQITMAEVPIEKAAAYAAADAAAVLLLKPELEKELKAAQAEKLFSEIEMPLVTVLADMEMTGIALDTHFLAEMSAELSQRLSEIENTVYKIAGEPFNLNSPQQLSEVLFNRLGIVPPDRTRKTASGHYSTAAGVLEELCGEHPLIDHILEYRELAKLKSTYLDALPNQVNPLTGRVHTNYNQTGSVTGRIASSEPNLQNIPIRTDIGRRVRRGFIAGAGKLLLGVDYSQVELRIVAHIANDEAMLAAFRAGQDIHATTAAAIYGVDIQDVTREQRRHAKAINFGLIYGMSPFGLTRSTDLTLAEAEDFVNTYFQRFPGVKHYLDNVRKQAAEQGFVETLLGRRRYFPGLARQTNQNIRNREEREAINAPIQGTAADIMKIAMLRVPSALDEAGLEARMLLQVHDELVLECPASELHEVAELVTKVMENAYTLKIPLVTEARFGRNWGSMAPVDN